MIDGLGSKVSEIVDELRVEVDAGRASEREIAALHFVDTFLAARARCSRGQCAPRGVHVTTVCQASGKSRSASSGSERPLAGAV